jgi:hypothetical protein
VALILALCGLAGSALSSCKKKGPKTASAELAANTTALQKQVKKVIKGKTRRENVLLLLDDADRIREKLTLAFLDLQHKVRKDPQISRGDFEAVLVEFAVIRKDAIKASANTRLEMRNYINEKEWKKLFPKPKKKKGDENTPESGDTETAPEGADDAPESPGESASEAETSTEVAEKPESEE